MYDTRSDFSQPNPNCGGCDYTDWNPSVCNSTNHWTASRAVTDSKMINYCSNTVMSTYGSCDYCNSGLSEEKIHPNGYFEYSEETYKYHVDENSEKICDIKNDYCIDQNLNNIGNFSVLHKKTTERLFFNTYYFWCTMVCAIHQSCDSSLKTRTFWTEGEPNDSNNEDYAEFVKYFNHENESNVEDFWPDGVWKRYGGGNDVPGNLSNKGICEYEDESTGDFKYNGHSYSLSTATGWEAARNECCSEGGYLANIHTYNENKFIYDAFLDSLVFKDPGRYYIGYSDKDSEGTWKWYKCED